jgi:hypothetical protein
VFKVLIYLSIFFINLSTFNLSLIFFNSNFEGSMLENNIKSLLVDDMGMNIIKHNIVITDINILNIFNSLSNR